MLILYDSHVQNRLRANPNHLKLQTMLLRPFFSPLSISEDLLDPEKWRLDADLDFFPGTFKTESQRLSRTSHPHLRLEECMIPMPPIEPGDTVWWHTDVRLSAFQILSVGFFFSLTCLQTCHTVDPVHNGDENASVVNIPACPATPTNKAYNKKQLVAISTARDRRTTSRKARCWMRGRSRAMLV